MFDADEYSKSREALVAEDLRRNMDKFYWEMGETIADAMKDPTVVEVMLNEDGIVWIERLGLEGMTELCPMDPVSATQLLGTIAHMLGGVINARKPIISGELPSDGSRIEASVPPISPAPTFNIRKKASCVFPFEAYIQSGRATEKDHEIIKDLVRKRKNILVVGGTGTGKTTFTNAILHEMYLQTPKHRVLIIEDTTELQCAIKNKTQLRTFQDEEIEITMEMLLKSTMRRRPDRIIVGEVRGKEALTMLKAWNTGHPGGICTVHANDAKAAFIRIEQLIAENNIFAPMQGLIAEAINVAICLERDPEIGPKLAEIVAVEGVRDGQYLFRNLRD